MGSLNPLLRFLLLIGYLRGSLPLLWRLHRNPRVPLWAKLLLPLGLIYLAVPRDLIPDLVPGMGLLDDALLLGLLLYGLPKLARRFSPEERDQRRDAIEGDYRVLEDEPPP